MKTIVQTGELPNKGLQLTKAARCAPFAFRSWGQSLRAALAAQFSVSPTHEMALFGQ